MLYLATGASTESDALRSIDVVALDELAVEQRASSPRRVRLREGAILDLAPGAVIRPGRNDEALIELHLERGRATFDVAPSTGRTWRVHAGLVTVEVIGTVFTVSRMDDRVRVTVARGRVRVSGEQVAESEQLLSMGDVLEVGPGDPSEDLDGGLLAASSAEAAPADAVEDSEPPTELRPLSGERNWRRAALRGDWVDAYEALGGLELSALARRSESVEELLLLADVARRSGHPAEAVEPLRRALREHPSDRRATVAAFTLGRVEADQLGRPERAAQAFRRCLELGPPAALREDAMARLAEAHARAGQYDQARVAAEEYLRHYPEGSRAPALRRWVEPR
jgi:transmembrane sensor